MLKGSLNAKKLKPERRLMRPASGVANSTPVPSVLALKPTAQERNGLSSGAIVGARWRGTVRTYASSTGGAVVDGAGSGVRARPLLMDGARLSGGDDDVFTRLTGCGF